MQPENTALNQKKQAKTARHKNTNRVSVFRWRSEEGLCIMPIADA